MEHFIEFYNNYIKVREATKQGYAIATTGDSINLEQPNSKTRRGRVGKQMANTLTCSCNQGVVEEFNKIKEIGQASSSGSQAGKVYSSQGIFPTICSCTHGYAIGNILEDFNEGNFYNNKLQEEKFNMSKIKLFDSFAGKGALYKALKKLGIPTEVIGLSEIEPDAIIAYAAVHIKDFKKIEFKYPSDDDMRNELMNINVGWDFTKQKSSIPRMKKEKLKLLYKANKLTNNFGDISILDYPSLPDFDLFNFSFPCTDISNAGKQKGLRNEDGTHTRSGLVKFGINLIKSKKPKYIMIENVKALITKKFIDDFYDIINEIESYGYKCFYPTKKDQKRNISPTCLNAKDFGIPQNRERIFVICIRNDIDLNFSFPKGEKKIVRLKDFLEDRVEEKYYLNDAMQNKFKVSYHKTFDYNLDHNLRIRKLTPLECWRLMGFDDKDFYHTKELGLSDSSLYKLAGNSIVVNCLYYIFKEVFKEYIINKEENNTYIKTA